MVKISRSPLRSDLWERIFDLFVGTLADLTDKHKLSAFIEEFYSPTEKIMLAKRLALMVLIAKGHDYKSIRIILRISPSTIAKMSLKIKYEGKGLKPVIEDIFKKQSSQIIWKEIQSIFDNPTKATLKSPTRLKNEILSKQKIEEIKSEF
jgi:uncharacterized protein YerC